MHSETAGEGKPSFVFVHGFSCDHTDWRSQMEALKARHRVVACDLRGHGSTPGEPAECTIDIYGNDVTKLVASLDLAPAVLVGHSMGCRVVLAAALERPEQLAGVVLIDGSCTASGDPEAAEKAMRDKVSTMGYPAFSEERFHDMFPVPNRISEQLIARSRTLPAAIGSVLFPRMSRWDAEHMESALGALELPLMVIQSTYLGPTLKREVLAPGQTSPWLELVRKNAPRARIEVITGVGHFTQLEAAEKVSELLSAFVG